MSGLNTTGKTNDNASDNTNVEDNSAVCQPQSAPENTDCNRPSIDTSHLKGSEATPKFPTVKRKRTSLVKSETSKSKKAPGVKKGKSKKKGKSLSSDDLEAVVKRDGPHVAKKSTAKQSKYESKEGILWTRNSPSAHPKQFYTSQQEVPHITNPEQVEESGGEASVHTVLAIAPEKMQGRSNNPSIPESASHKRKRQKVEKSNEQTVSANENTPGSSSNTTIVVMIEQDKNTGKSTVVNIKTENTEEEEMSGNVEGNFNYS